MTTRLGIIGGGQLGRMLALAALPLDVRCVTLDPSSESPASHVAPSIVGGYDDPDALTRLAERVDVVTYEFENVPVASARLLEVRLPVFPPPAALEAAQDRVAEKALFERVGLPVARYVSVDSLIDLERALDAIGAPAVLKTRRLGYDGKGQAVVRDPLLAEDAWRSVGEVPCILEELVGFDREVSIVGARGRDGATTVYPLVENEHRDGILRMTRAPAPGLTPDLQARAEVHIRAVMEVLDHVGVLAIELFQRGGELLGNEMAPRVHNSGHWTIEGAETSQFEQHVRAVCGFPLGPTTTVGYAAMVNLIGHAPDTARVAALPGAHLHLYGKAARAGRKLGHVTVRVDDPLVLEPLVLQVRALADDA